MGEEERALIRLGLHILNLSDSRGAYSRRGLVIRGFTVLNRTKIWKNCLVPGP